MHALVTGVAGFIGSHVAEALIARGDRVTGVDCFLDYYPRAVKERNLAGLRAAKQFAMVEADLASAPLEPLVGPVDAVLHLAAQAGVRASWGRDFKVYADSNVLATQRLLEACAPGKKRLVYSSSSSIYGDAPDLPTVESTLPQPISPYGVTKLAGEHLCRLYTHSAAVPTIALRYFTVYGPRQRPDMAFHRFVRAQLTGEEITVYDDGEQTRDFTFVGDAVQANLLALERGTPGAAYNIGGGSRVTLKQVLALIAEISGRPPRVRHAERQRGDVRDTHASTERARRELGWSPRTAIAQGLAAETEWLRGELDGGR
ncbi:MAG TPA: NAD-dependent epimerase/dehydratase family protein [Candidatus Bathyarchaeia archaeon]|nr:NAD-dependent epimerase/dehydratase family protein [Candidatus Bathyarchaeia archaeon]